MHDILTDIVVFRMYINYIIIIIIHYYACVLRVKFARANPSRQFGRTILYRYNNNRTRDACIRNYTTPHIQRRYCNMDAPRRMMTATHNIYI